MPKDLKVVSHSTQFQLTTGKVQETHEREVISGYSEKSTEEIPSIQGPSPEESNHNNAVQPSGNDRRRFIESVIIVSVLAAGVGSLALLRYMFPRGSSPTVFTRQKVLVDYLPDLYSAVAGKAVNVRDLTSFPPNSSWVITYPSSGDPIADAKIIDTFKKFALIRLPVELGGDRQDASAFVAFSKVCVHLECSPNYNPTQTSNPAGNGYEAGPGYTNHQQFECPCHGSTYRLPEGLAVEPPASRQPPPTNAVPMLTLSEDGQGYLWIEPPIFDVNHNGKIGYGRYV